MLKLDAGQDRKPGELRRLDAGGAVNDDIILADQHGRAKPESLDGRRNLTNMGRLEFPNRMRWRFQIGNATLYNFELWKKVVANLAPYSGRVRQRGFVAAAGLVAKL